MFRFLLTALLSGFIFFYPVFGQSGYTPILSGPTEVEAGRTYNYTVTWESMSPPSGGTYKWSVYGGTNYSSSTNSAYVSWNGAGTIIYEYTYGGTTYSDYLSVNTSSCVATPSTTISLDPDNCAPRVLSYAGDPPPGVTWYWQTNSTGTSTLAPGRWYFVNSPGVYYLRARHNTAGCWSTGAASWYVSFVSPAPATPPAPFVISTDPCGSKALSYASPPPGVTYYWQGSNPTGTSTTSTGTTLALVSGSYYLRARDNATGCWSISTSYTSVTINNPPAPPAPAATTHYCGAQTLTKDGSPQTGVNWYWQGTDPNGEDNTSSIATRSTFTAYTSGRYYLRARSNLGCWSYASSVDVDVYIPPTPDIPTAVDATHVLSSSFQANWLSVSDADGYEIEISRENTFETIMITTTSTGTSALISGLRGGVTYYFRVRARKDCVYSNRSAGKDVLLLPNYNSIISTKVIQPDVYTENDVSQATFEKKIVTIDYFDGIGRPAQTVNKQSSRSGYDIIVPIDYDAYSRKVKGYLPYVSGGATGAYQYHAITDQLAFYDNGSSDDVIDDTRPYSTIVLEPSPLGRILKEAAPGTVWQPSLEESDYTDKTVKKKYVTNAENEVLKWSYIASSNSISAKDASQNLVYYSPSQLYANATFDEHNMMIIEYIDKLGRVILKRVQIGPNQTPVDETNFASTYYIYDDFGNLVVVLPPEAVKEMLSH